MNPRLRYPKKSSRRCRAYARLIRPRRLPRLAPPATGGARLVIHLRYPKKSSRRCRARARLIRPLRLPRLASSATGGARLVTRLRYPKKSSRRCRAHARLIRPLRLPRLAPPATGGARLVTPQTPCSPPISDGARGRPVGVGALGGPFPKAPNDIWGDGGVWGG